MGFTCGFTGFTYGLVGIVVIELLTGLLNLHKKIWDLFKRCDFFFHLFELLIIRRI